MKVLIRKAIIEDLPSIQELSQELFYSDYSHDPLLNIDWTYSKEGEESFRSRITEENRFCFVAIVDEKIIGYSTGSVMQILAWRPVKRLEMENLIVTKNYRGQGIGEMLAKKVFELGKLLGMERIMVSACAINDGAVRFYKRIGFVPDSLQLEKVLDPFG